MIMETDYQCPHDCSTCEFRMPDSLRHCFVCAGLTELYGVPIAEIPASQFPCYGWGISYDEFCNQIDLGVVII